MEPQDPNEPLTKKQLAAVKAAKDAEMDRQMQDKLHKDFPTYAPKKPKGFAKGGSVRGSGCARKGVRKCKMH